jgi:hypothetical protein
MTIPPLITLSAFPEDERKAVHGLKTQLHMLNTYVTRFRNTFALYEWANAQAAQQIVQLRTAPMEQRDATHERLAMFGDWSALANRDAPLTINYFRLTMYKANDARKKGKTLDRLSNGRMLHDTIQKFDEYFPNALLNRNAASHEAEVMNTPKRNAFKGSFKAPGLTIEDVGGVTITDGSFGDETVRTYQGENLQLNLMQSLERLQEIQNLIYEAFSELPQFRPSEMRWR